MRSRFLGIWLVAATALTPILSQAAQAQDEEPVLTQEDARGGDFGSRVMREARTGGGNRGQRQDAPQREDAPQRPERQERPQRQEQPQQPQEQYRRQGRDGNGGGQRWQGRQGGGQGGANDGAGDGERRGNWEARRGEQQRGEQQRRIPQAPNWDRQWDRRGDGNRQPGDGTVQRNDNRRDGGFGTRIIRDAEGGYIPPQRGGTFDRNGDGNVDRNWDRNRDNRVDERYDNNRNGRLDRRWDRNDDERLDRRYDRNGDGRFDRGHRGDNRYGWDRGWRDDRRYDWRGHRTRYNHIYRQPRYYSPYRDWRYQSLSIGFSLRSLFYSNQYWISDPWQYRLPEAYGPYRWVRYYDDALLVDVRTGEVVDVIQGVFW